MINTEHRTLTYVHIDISNVIDNELIVCVTLLLMNKGTEMTNFIMIKCIPEEKILQ